MLTWIMVIGVAAVFFVGSAWLFNKLGQGPLGRWYAGKSGASAADEASGEPAELLALDADGEGRFSQEPATDATER